MDASCQHRQLAPARLTRTRVEELLQDRIARYETALDAITAASDPEQALDTMAVTTAGEPDAIAWYYRGAALTRLGRHQEALDAYSIAADMGGAVTDTDADTDGDGAQDEPTPTPSAQVEKRLPVPPPVAAPARPEAEEIVTLVGPARADISLSGMFLAIKLDSTPKPLITPDNPVTDIPVTEVAVAQLAVTDIPVTEVAVSEVAVADATPEPDPPETVSLDTAGWYFRGVTQAKEERFADAIRSYNRATTLDPANLAAWHYMGIALARLGRHQEAVSAFTRAIELDHRNSAVWISMAMSMTKLERFAHAELAHARARDLDVELRHGRREVGRRDRRRQRVGSSLASWAW